MTPAAIASHDCIESALLIGKLEDVIVKATRLQPRGRDPQLLCLLEHLEGCRGGVMTEMDVCLGLGSAATLGTVGWSISRAEIVADPGLMGVTGKS